MCIRDSLNPVRPNMAHCVVVPSHRYHPVGFAYIAGGAHTECKQDQAGNLGECPELGGEDGGTTIQYYVDGVAVTDDESGFGLDAYEPLFFFPQEEWVGEYSVELTVPAVSVRPTTRSGGLTTSCPWTASSTTMPGTRRCG